MGFCSCIPPPASLQPRKVYNVLVPDVFPPQPPPVTEAVPNSIRRKIAKLHEYVQRSPGKIAKVWPHAATDAMQVCACSGHRLSAAACMHAGVPSVEQALEAGAVR